MDRVVFCKSSTYSRIKSEANANLSTSSYECANLKGKWVKESDVESHLEQCKH